MKPHILIAIRDRKLETTMFPYFAKSEAVALTIAERSFPSTENPDDYELLVLGDFDPDTSKLTAYDIPRPIPMPHPKKEVKNG